MSKKSKPEEGKSLFPIRVDRPMCLRIRNGHREKTLSFGPNVGARETWFVVDELASRNEHFDVFVALNPDRVAEGWTIA